MTVKQSYVVDTETMTHLQTGETVVVKVGMTVARVEWSNFMQELVLDLTQYGFRLWHDGVLNIREIEQSQGIALVEVEV